MIEFVLADDEARQLAAARPGGLAQARGVAVRLTTDLVKSAWSELMKSRPDDHGPSRRLTADTPLWSGGAHLSLAHARVAVALDGGLRDDTVASSLGGEEMQVTGNVEIHPERLIMSTHATAPVEPFALRPLGPVHVTGVVDGNPGDNAFVVTLSDGHRVVVHLGRARKLAEYLGTLRPG